MRRRIEALENAKEVSYKEPTEYILEWFDPEIDIPPRPGVIYLKWVDEVRP